jgi:hypothetical protein
LLLCLLQPLAIDICQNHMRSPASQGFRGREPNAARSTRNYRYCIRKVRQSHLKYSFCQSPEV